MRIWYPRDRRLMTVSAARRARDVAESLRADPACAEKFDEHTLFVALHACGYRAARRTRTVVVKPSERAAWMRLWAEIRTALVKRNLGLVFLGVRRVSAPGLDRDDFFGEGMLALVRAVDRFDPWRGVRFSTYAYNSIIRALARIRGRADQYRRLFPVPFEATVEKPEHPDWSSALYVDRLRHVLQHNLGELTDREAKVLQLRFPIDEDEPRLTLEQIGADCGLSKERIRQIQNRALRKLRGVLAVDPLLQ